MSSYTWSTFNTGVISRLWYWWRTCRWQKNFSVELSPIYLFPITEINAYLYINATRKIFIWNENFNKDKLFLYGPLVRFIWLSLCPDNRWSVLFDRSFIWALNRLILSVTLLRPVTCPVFFIKKNWFWRDWTLDTLFFLEIPYP